MHLRVRSLDPAVRPFCDEFVAADALVADEAEMTDFRLSSKERTNDGYVLTGVYDKEGIRVEKHQKITAPAEFPGMLVVDTYYVNRGIPVTVSALVSNSLRVEADSLVWSFEPSSTSARADWILPVRPGFEQRNYLGMNNSDYGGGIPMVTLWRPDGGISVGLTEKTLKPVSMPVQWRSNDRYATLGLRRDFDEKVRMEPATRWRPTRVSSRPTGAISTTRSTGFRSICSVRAASSSLPRSPELSSPCGAPGAMSGPSRPTR